MGCWVALVTREEASRWGLGSRCRLPNKAVGCQAERQGFERDPLTPLLWLGLGVVEVAHTQLQSSGHPRDIPLIYMRKKTDRGVGWGQRLSKTKQRKEESCHMVEMTTGNVDKGCAYVWVWICVMKRWFFLKPRK